MASSITALPVEVTSAIIDRLNVQQLLTFSHVCARWNTIARAHPMFWRDISLAALSDTAVQFFEVRLYQAMHRKVSIKLLLGDCSASERLCSDVLPAITRSLSHIFYLDLELHADAWIYAVSALSRPAPFLQCLRIGLHHYTSTRPVPTLRSDLFAGDGARLSRVALLDIDLPKRTLQAFKHVESLRLQRLGVRHAIPPELFNQFPALRRLSVKTEFGIYPPKRFSGSAAGQPLEELGLTLKFRQYDPRTLSFPDFTSITHIVCEGPAEELWRVLIGQLSGSVELRFLTLGDAHVRASVHEPSSGRFRSIIEHSANISTTVVRRVFFAPSVLCRATAVRLSPRLAHHVPGDVELPACRTLEVSLSEILFPLQDATAPAAPLRLPELYTLIVSPRNDPLVALPADIVVTAVDAELLDVFLSKLTGAQHTGRCLCMRGVALLGKREALVRQFANIVVS